MIITTKMLRNWCACKSQVKDFKKLFGRCVEVTPENIEMAIDAGLSPGFITISIASDHGFSREERDLYYSLHNLGLSYPEACGIMLLDIAEGTKR